MQKYLNQDAIKLEVLKDIEGDLEILKKQLKDYIFVNEIGDLQPGTFIRAFFSGKLLSPCIFCEIKFTTEGMSLFCRNLYKPIFFHINIEKTIVFRKLTKEEKIILKALKTIK
jgi:hypothetical protein